MSCFIHIIQWVGLNINPVQDNCANVTISGRLLDFSQLCFHLCAIQHSRGKVLYYTDYIILSFWWYRLLYVGLDYPVSYPHC